MDIQGMIWQLKNAHVSPDDGYIKVSPGARDIIIAMLELLKEQQAETERMKGEGKSPTWRRGKAFCGGCGGCLENKEQHSSDIVKSIRFCKWCGTPVDWSNE